MWCALPAHLGGVRGRDAVSFMREYRAVLGGVGGHCGFSVKFTFRKIPLSTMVCVGGGREGGQEGDRWQRGDQLGGMMATQVEKDRKWPGLRVGQWGRERVGMGTPTLGPGGLTHPGHGHRLTRHL